MRAVRVFALTAVVLLVTAATALGAFDPLPGDGSQVNNDPSAGIDPSKDVGQSDVTGGSLTGGVAVPWATFEPTTTGQQQVFVRAFKAGAWATEGHGTVNGLGATTFPGSLHFHQSQAGQAPSIDSAGTGGPLRSPARDGGGRRRGRRGTTPRHRCGGPGSFVGAASTRRRTNG